MTGYRPGAASPAARKPLDDSSSEGGGSRTVEASRATVYDAVAGKKTRARVLMRA